jgi:hypothetical protein
MSNPLTADLAKILGGPEYYVGWGTLALINAGLAQSKNRSGFLWFALSLFLGPIATFFIVAFERGNGAKSQPKFPTIQVTTNSG